MAFDKPQSRNEAILQNMLGASNELEPPKSRVEALLQELSGQMPEANPSEGTTTGTLERLKIGDDIYSVEGGGSGTSDYDALNNKPQIAGTTLSGNKSLADLGIASATTVSGILDGASIDSFADVETALAGKQDTLTFDNTPTENSTNPVKSGGIYSALAGKADTGIVADDFDSTASYVIGNYCIENGKLYRFKANHSGAWSASDVDEIQITGELATLKSGLTNLDNEVNGDATTYPYADVITVSDAVPANLADCSVKIEPVQDLHGYDKPWVGGDGKNKLPLVLADIKAANTVGTWTDNVYVINSVTFTANTDSDGNVTEIIANGMPNNANASIYLSKKPPLENDVSYILNGCPSNGGDNTYNIQYSNFVDNVYQDNGSGISLSKFDYTIYPNAAVVIRIMNGYNAQNVKFYPMIRLATETDATFAPYTNICPIIGHTEAVVTRDGKNLLNKDEIVSGSINTETGEPETSTTTKVTASIPVIAGENYVLSGVNGAVRPYYYGSTGYIGEGNLITSTVTIPQNATSIIMKGANAVWSGDDLQFELGSTATPYAPYAGQQYTLALGDTIYGGTIRIGSDGKVYMDVDKAIIDLGSVNWDYASVYTRFISDVVSNMKAVQMYTDDMLTCSCFDIDNAPVSGNENDGTICTYSNKRIYVNCYQYTDGTAFKTAMDGQKLVYLIAEPFTVQLSDLHIQLLQGQNTLYASTGDISVSVNGVSGAIWAVQTQANATDSALAQLAADIAEQLPDAPTTDGTYNLVCTVASGTATYSWVSTT